MISKRVEKIRLKNYKAKGYLIKLLLQIGYHSYNRTPQAYVIQAQIEGSL